MRPCQRENTDSAMVLDMVSDVDEQLVDNYMMYGTSEFALTGTHA
jgi:hypothetical protein